MDRSTQFLVGTLSAIIGCLVTVLAAMVPGHPEYCGLPLTVMLTWGMLLHFGQSGYKKWHKTNLVTVSAVLGMGVTLTPMAASIIPSDAQNGIVFTLTFICVSVGAVTGLVIINKPEQL